MSSTPARPKYRAVGAQRVKQWIPKGECKYCPMLTPELLPGGKEEEASRKVKGLNAKVTQGGCVSCLRTVSSSIGETGGAEHGREVSLDRKMETDSRRANYIMVRKSLDIFLMVRRRLATAYDINSVIFLHRRGN